MDHQFAIVGVETLNKLFNKLDSLEAKLEMLHHEKVLPEEFSVKGAAKELGLSSNRLYEMIYAREIKAIQHRKKGKYSILREEIIRFKSKNIKDVKD